MPEAGQALGYAEIRQFLDGSSDDEAGLRERIKVKTWQFARRQLTWMKKFQSARTLMRHPGDDLATWADRIVAGD